MGEERDEIAGQHRQDGLPENWRFEKGHIVVEFSKMLEFQYVRKKLVSTPICRRAKNRPRTDRLNGIFHAQGIVGERLRPIRQPAKNLTAEQSKTCRLAREV